MTLQYLRRFLTDSGTLTTLKLSQKSVNLRKPSALSGTSLQMTEFPSDAIITKRRLVSDVAKVFDVMGWFSPAIIKMKILLQRLWKIKLNWDDPIPDHIHQIWSQWRCELPQLTTIRIPRCYLPSKQTVVSTQLHGFSDASEEAYAGVVYIHLEYPTKRIHTSLIISKQRFLPSRDYLFPDLSCVELRSSLGCSVIR